MNILTDLMVMLCVAVLISGCGSNHTARIIELDNSLPAGTILTTISWEDRTICIVSAKKTEIREREIIIHSPIGIMGGKEYDTDWSMPIKIKTTLPLTLSLFILPNTADCWVCIGRKCILFPREIE